MGNPEGVCLQSQLAEAEDLREAVSHCLMGKPADKDPMTGMSREAELG